jgi:hypothetical protein
MGAILRNQSPEQTAKRLARLDQMGKAAAKASPLFAPMQTQAIKKMKSLLSANAASEKSSAPTSTQLSSSSGPALQPSDSGLKNTLGG